MAIYGIVEYWIDDGDEAPLPITVLFFVITAAVSYLLLAETNKLIRAAGGALVIAALLILPDYFLASKADGASTNLTPFPAIFWFLLSRGLVVYLLITLVKAASEKRNAAALF